MITTDRTAFYVALNQRFAYVRGLGVARATLASFLGVDVDSLPENLRKVAGLVKRVSAAEARAAGI